MQVEDERRHADQYKEQVGGSWVGGGHCPEMPQQTSQN